MATELSFGVHSQTIKAGASQEAGSSLHPSSSFVATSSLPSLLLLQLEMVAIFTLVSLALVAFVPSVQAVVANPSAPSVFPSLFSFQPPAPLPSSTLTPLSSSLLSLCTTSYTCPYAGAASSVYTAGPSTITRKLYCSSLKSTFRLRPPTSLLPSSIFPSPCPSSLRLLIDLPNSSIPFSLSQSVVSKSRLPPMELRSQTTEPPAASTLEVLSKDRRLLPI